MANNRMFLVQESTNLCNGRYIYSYIVKQVNTAHKANLPTGKVVI